MRATSQTDISVCAKHVTGHARRSAITSPVRCAMKWIKRLLQRHHNRRQQCRQEQDENAANEEAEWRRQIAECAPRADSDIVLNAMHAATTSLGLSAAGQTPA